MTASEELDLAKASITRLEKRLEKVAAERDAHLRAWKYALQHLEEARFKCVRCGVSNGSRTRP